MDNALQRIDALERLVMEVRAEIRSLQSSMAGEAVGEEGRGFFVEGGRGVNVRRVLGKFVVEAAAGGSADVDENSTGVCGWRYVPPSSSGGTGKIQVRYGHLGKNGNGEIAIIPDTYDETDAPTQADIGRPKWTDIVTVVEESY